jgi:hypothetical protein
VAGQGSIIATKAVTADHLRERATMLRFWGKDAVSSTVQVAPGQRR